MRYTGASLGYQGAGIIGGALAPIISTALLDRYDSWVPVALYVAGMLAISVVCVLVARETAHLDPDAEMLDEREVAAAGGR